MKKYNSMYLGICLNNDDPEKRGRVKVFVPHIMPTLYEGWNEEMQDIDITCVGNNLVDGLSNEIVERLNQMLPWAEAASPIVGSSAPGQIRGGRTTGIYDQSPVHVESTVSGSTQELIKGASSLWVGNDGRASEVKSTYGTFSSDKGNCLRGVQGIAGAMFKHDRFNVRKSGGLSNHAKDFSISGGKTLTGTGLYDTPEPIDNTYIKDPKKWLPGDIVASDGHIQIWTGSSWMSDYTQNGILTENKSGKQYGDFTLHRPNPVGKARLNQLPSESKTTQLIETVSTSGEVAAPSVHSKSDPIISDPSDPLFGSAANPDIEPLGTAPSEVKLQLSNSQQTTMKYFRQAWEQNKEDYQKVSEELNKRGYNLTAEQIATMHYREASGDMTKSIANGSPINSYVRKDGKAEKGNANTSFNPTNVWSDSAVEVLEYKLQEKYQAEAKNKDFSQDVQFYDFAERFNGLGYRQNKTASPYVYSGTNQYGAGLYKSDGNFDPNHVDGRPGVAAMLSEVTGKPITVSASELAKQPIFARNSGMVENVNKHGPIVTQNLNNLAKGLFSFPAAGAMLWVFFREGNPLFPVYFAASYSQTEWNNAYGNNGADGPGYKPGSSSPADTTSTGGILNCDGVGGMRWQNNSNMSDKTKEDKHFMVFGPDGSNVFMGDGYSQIFSKFDRVDQTEGNKWLTTLGYEEKWVQGNSSKVILGNSREFVGDCSQNAMNIVSKIQDIICEIMKPLSE